MDQPQQPQGNFVMNLNYRRKTNENAPAVTGRISAPEEPDVAYSFSAFAHEDDKGRPYWIGPVDANRTMRRALNATNERGTHFIAIRENEFKVFKELPDGTPNPDYTRLSKQEQELEDSKPSYWASWTRTLDQPQIRASAWEREPTRYGPWASGNTQYPLTKEEAAALKAGQPGLDFLGSREAPRTAPKPRRTDERTSSRAG